MARPRKVELAVFGERLREALGHSRFATRTELVQELDIPAPTLWRYEIGKHPAPSDLVARIAGLLGVSSDYLLGLDEPANASPPGPVPPAFFEFLETEAGKSMTADERKTLRGLRAYGGEATVASFALMLSVIRSTFTH